ncbi:MAG: hypothetical protein U5K99_05490 [Anaerolineales bacterium]|nr:hypothetical protein [Anaerolineales bacterium]
MMAEIICQMCGQANPEDQDTCQNCDARLSPLVASTPEDQIPEEPQDSPPDLTPVEDQTAAEDLPTPDLEDDDPSSWLDELRDDDEPDDDDLLPSSFADAEEPADADTDWLDRIKKLDGESADQEEEIEKTGDAFPSWMTADTETQPASEDHEPPDDSPEELPEWLQLETDELGLEPEEDQSGEEDADYQQLRELLGEDSEQEDPQPESREIPDAVQSGADREPPREEPKQEPDSEKEERASIFPSWAAEEKTHPPDIGEIDTEDIPADLQFLTGEEPAKEKTAESVDPFDIGGDDEEDLFDDLFEEDLPSWLTSAVDEDQDQDASAAISPGDLPGWVQAMRPVVEETGRSGLAEDEEYIENYGPLAGIASIIPAEADIESSKPGDATQSSLTLSVSKTQREYAELLEKVIGQESKSETVPEPVSAPTQRVLRWLITLLLIVTLGGAIIFGRGIENQPLNNSNQERSGHVALYELISDLEEEEPILIAFDYQPALLGELSYSASSVIDHLISQGVYISMISTQPTGPALAEYFIQTTQVKHEYAPGLNYINLGYLPGGAAGLLSFTIEPTKIIPLAFNGSNAWDSPPLAEVNAINDFSLILIITDDPTTAKIWVEQVQTSSTPDMGMIVSAQAEPLIQAYYHTSPRQISGYVAGVLGGYAYEQLSENPNLANTAWLPYNLGIILAAAVIFVGGLANGILTLVKGQNKGPRGEGSS